MSHPILYCFGAAIVLLVITSGYAIWQYRNNDSDDILSIGTVLLIFISVIASVIYFFVFLEAYRNGVL